MKDGVISFAKLWITLEVPREAETVRPFAVRDQRRDMGSDTVWVAMKACR